MRFPALSRTFCVIAAFAAARGILAQGQDVSTNAANKLPPATPATTNLFVTNIGTGTNLFANTNGLTRGLGLLEALRMAISNNFDVQIERFAPLIAETDIESAKGAYDPVISAAGRHTDTKVNGAHDRSETVNVGLNGALPTGATYNLGVDANENASRTISPNILTQSGVANGTLINARQPLLRNMWIDQVRWQIEFNRKQLRISELALRLQLLSTASQVEQAYFEWIAARENVRVQEEAVALARQQAKEYSLRAQIGTARPLDQQRFESQAASSEAALLLARRTQREQETLLLNLITSQYEAWQGYALEPLDKLPTVERTYDLQTSWTTAFDKRPDLHQLIVSLEQLGLTEKLRYNAIFPTLDLTGMYGYLGTQDSLRGAYADLADANKPTWAVGLEATFPIGNRTARAGLRAVRLEKAQATEKLKQARQTIMVQVENAIVEARTGWERIPATRAAREYAASALKAGQLQLQQGQLTPLDILSLQQQLTSARSDEIRALVDYSKAVTVYLEREGTLLDERGLSLNVH